MIIDLAKSFCQNVLICIHSYLLPDKSALLSPLISRAVEWKEKVFERSECKNRLFKAKKLKTLWR